MNNCSTVTSIQEIFENQVSINPHNTAITGFSYSTGSQIDLSYDELNRKSNQLAHILIKKGVTTDTVVGILLDRSIELVISILAILKSGAAYLPLAPGYPEEKITSIINNSRLSLILTAREIDRNKPGTETIFVDNPAGNREQEENPCAPSSPESLAYVLYTSGSTGEPRGVMIEQGSVINRLSWMQKKWPLGREDSILVKSAVTFDVLTMEIFCGLLYGARLYILEKDGEREPFTLLKAIKNEKITYIHLVPSLLNVLLDYIQDHIENHIDLASGLKRVSVGGEELPASVAKKFKKVLYKKNGTTLHNLYGQTETTIDVTSYDIDFDTPLDTSGNSIPIGKPIDNIKIYIIDKNNNKISPGDKGELCISGMGLARGYLANPEQTREKFIPNPFSHESPEHQTLYKTGDIVRELRGGNIEFLGRKDNQVKIHGYRIELEEIEAVLAGFETVREAVVTAGNHEHLCAYISGKAAKEEIKSYLAKKIPRYMIPSYYVFLEAFPRLSNGKINRKALPAPGPKIAAAGGAYSPPSNETEKKLQTIWTGILKVKKISVDDNLFDIGSNSLQAMIAALQIRKIFDIETEIKDIFKNPTIQKLAARISHLKTGPSPKKNHTVPVQRAPQQEYYPLSSAQKRIYFLQQLEPGSTHYNIASLTRIEGDIDRARLESAFRKIIERHESLRTGFEIVNNQPVQKIHDTSIINNIDNTLINYIDCTKNVDEYIKQGVKPFNPAKPPLIRFTVMRTNHAGMEPVHFLLIDMHHIISDGLSIEILKKEISCIYNGQPLEKIYLQYKDYAVWQNLLSNPANKGWNETCREYWVNRLSGEIPVLPLPVDYPRPSVQSFEGQNLEFITGNHLTQKLKQVAHQNNSTLYMLLLAAYAVLLYKYTGQEDIIVGCPVANRTDADLFPIVGMFVNTLPLRNYPKGKKKFNNFLREVTEQTLNDFKHQDYQLEELVANLEIERDPARNPLFDTVLLLHNMDKEVIHLDNTPAAPCRLARNTSRFDLKPEAMETEGRLSWNVEYCTKLYKKETIETLFSHFSNILYSLAENRGNISIAAVNILSLPEKKQLVTPAALNNNTDYTKYRTIHQLFEEQAKRSPGAPALRFENITMTYGELNDRANALAGFLIEKGAAAESIVGLLTDRSPEMITGILAILKAGGAYLPIDTESPHNRTAYLLQNSGAKILLTQKKYISKTFDAVENIDINVDINIDSTQCPNPGTKARENNLAYVIHTSGTTGKPKGVMIEHAQLINYTLSVLKRIALPWSSHFALVSPVFADLGNTMIFGALCSGGCLHVISKERSLNPVTMAEYFANNAIDCLKIVPSHLKALALNRDIQELLPRKLLILGGEASKTGWVREIQKAASDLRIMNHFGPSEAAIGITSYEATKTTFRDFPDQLPLGSPLDNNCLYILDKDMQPVPPGITGEIYLGGKNIARGYINRQDLTTESFVPNPFNTTDLHKEYARLYKTGDLAVRLSNGNFLFKGRKDDQVKISGYRVELPEIKSILNTHPLINNSVIVLSGKNGSKKLAAYVVLEPGKNIDHMARELRDFLSSTLPPYMIPGFFISIENIPLNKNGKVDRKALPEPGGIEDPEESNPPAPGMETRLAKIWSRVLEVQEKTVSRNSNFFDHGSSLKAIILVSAIHKEMNIEIPVIELFKKPLLKDIARFMRGAEKNHFKAIEPVPVLSAGKAVYPLSSAQKRMFVLYRMQKESINYNRTILFKIEGKAGREIDIQRLEKTFQQLIERYEIFRTGFDICENEAVQKIYLPHEMSSFSINYPDSIQDSIQDFIQPFDLSAPPLLRAVLVKSPDPHSYLLMIDSHHIITDGTSIRIVLKEFSDIYNGSTVPEIRIQYKDYAIWQKELFQTEGFKKQEQFWLETFQGELPVLDFPTDFPRPAVMSLEGSLLHFTIDTKITRPLLELAKENKATLFMVLFAAYSILLYRYTGQDDIVVGTGIANRAHADLQDMPGMFVNTLALRNSIDDSKSFPEFLQGVKNNVLQAYENQDYQFEELVEKLEPVRDTGRNPLFDTVFILQNIEKPALTLEGLKTESVPQACDTSKFDITVETREQNGAIEGKIEYCTKLFREETIRRFAEHFTHVLQEITAVPDRKIEDIYILSSNEKKQLLNDFNPQETPYSSNTTIHQIFEEQVKKTPGNTAAIFENKRVSYEELNNRSNQLARVLREKGIKPDTVAGIMVHRSLDMILGIMAILKAGGAYLPISPDYPQDRIRFMLEESEAQIVLTTKNEGDNFIEQTLPGGILYLDKPEWLDRSTENLPGINSPGNLAYVIYTSGSTGKPKGVMIEHHSLINRIEWMQKQYPITEQDTILQKTPYTFDVSVWELFWWAFQGARVSFLVPGGEKDPAEIIRAIEKN
ncbi:MAG: amino acid adenylation domain-containing protein, partial [bacterium]|nr:amino acid adenylation domain-containing protein [bacterium]